MSGSSRSSRDFVNGVVIREPNVVVTTTAIFTMYQVGFSSMLSQWREGDIHFGSPLYQDTNLSSFACTLHVYWKDSAHYAGQLLRSRRL